MTVFKHILKTQNLNQIGQKVRFTRMLEQFSAVLVAEFP